MRTIIRTLIRTKVGLLSEVAQVVRTEVAHEATRT
jgi:hypothetical protein